MIAYIRTLSVVVLFLVVSISVSAQFKDPGWSFGVGGGVVSGQSDDVKNKPKVGGRGFVRYGFASHLQGELSGGYGEIGGPSPQYKTSLIPMDLRLLYSPLDMKSWNPYIYVGGGVIMYKIQEGTNPGTRYPGTTSWTMFVPAGLGLQARLSDNISLEVNGGFHYSFIDTLDEVIKGSQKDAFWSGLIGLTYTLESGSADPDKDGLPNYLEKQLATDPKNPDTDGDGLTDGDEYYKYKTNPRKADTDGDGLSDADEIFKYRTNPLKADTDGDGLADGDEIIKYKTDPLIADSDADGLTDGDEVLKYKTDPLAADTDRDGLNDGDEVNRYKTDPLKIDTDLGGVNDGTEIARGTDPLNPKDDLPKKEEVKIGKRIVLEGINFKPGSAELTPESVARLEEVFITLRDNQDIEVEISGHTDNKGKRSKNIELSLARAEAVKTYLVARGIAGHRIRTKGYGPDRPIASNTTEDGRAKNRRIEFTRIR